MRTTFVIQVYAEGPCTLENLSTEERVLVPDLAAVGTQIERWLAGAEPGRDLSRVDSPQRGRS